MPDASLPELESAGARLHRCTFRVYYEDTDFSGFVYHARYLHFMERGRTESLRAIGFDQRTLHDAPGGPFAFVVRRMEIDFLRPAFMDDLVTVETGTEDLRGASILMAQRLLRGAEVLMTAKVRVAFLAAGRPARLPDNIRALMGGDGVAEVAPGR